MVSIDIQPTLEDRAPPVPRDLKHVSLAADLEVRYWSQRFHSSRRELEKAVECVGHSVNAVADFLNRNR
ncbi:MAG TPA: DUF3606 domain-containing protein [Sphingobium sp.]|nr:DUF3606 domain-containing protein [Sphingobium sp.]